jgi:two-component system, OmpR family, response regulator
LRILIIEDDKKIAAFIVKGFKQEGFAVDHATDGEDGLYSALHGSYDAAVIDIMLPKRDGLSVIAEMRLRKVNTPVLILSAKHTVDDRVKGLRAGGDDYLVKPFAFSELIARIQALIRRAGAIELSHACVTVGDLSIDLVSREVTRKGKRIDLKPLDFSLLEYLVRNAGRVVTKTMIIEHVWGYDFDPGTNVLEARVCKLREKIEREFDKKFIHTIRGVGYVLRED